MKTWHRWFSWRPVGVEGKTVWLVLVERRQLSWEFGGYVTREYQYRDLPR